jgi:hypothetical protein
MAALNTTGRLEALKREIEAARDTKHTYPGTFTKGITAGLQIALDAIENHLLFARALEAATAKDQ